MRVLNEGLNPPLLFMRQQRGGKATRTLPFYATTAKQTVNFINPNIEPKL
jgi:hypothetical protein